MLQTGAREMDHSRPSAHLVLVQDGSTQSGRTVCERKCHARDR